MNGAALLGLAVVAGGVFVASRADVRHSIETSALGWLQARQEARAALPSLALFGLIETAKRA